ncbi:NUDIX domain-containing protein [Flavobacterium sp. 90]|uniref:NUDIX hydrolase n=1 Tax=unclassified Flavobacterium TaxID=196869 RepID=UPI000EB2E910|nr:MULTISPECIES: NUDIX domain-containing protein [unclassified Flavobacterium]RKR08952.1 NUDIX domain-containing protein [Flavobacterium sp. 81]TCK52740.1 NUDIX domain-containing protein [Flavobacterium sp. 90]
MELKKILEKRSEESWEKYIPALSIDCTIFSFKDTSLKVLTIKMKDQESWGLPGGYVQKDENVDHAAIRILKDRTGTEDIYLQQFYTFGNLNRSESFFDNYQDNLWNKQRFVSIGYYALADYSKVKLIIDEFSSDCKWHCVNDLPCLMMDHRVIFEKALFTLREQLNNHPIGYNLLPEKFTIPELQKLYEIILGKKLNRGNFYRKILKYDILTKLDEYRKGGAHKAPDLYSFNLEKYNVALKEGLKGNW